MLLRGCATAAAAAVAAARASARGCVCVGERMGVSVRVPVGMPVAPVRGVHSRRALRRLFPAQTLPARTRRVRELYEEFLPPEVLQEVMQSDRTARKYGGRSLTDEATVQLVLESAGPMDKRLKYTAHLMHDEDAVRNSMLPNGYTPPPEPPMPSLHRRVMECVAQGDKDLSDTNLLPFHVMRSSPGRMLPVYTKYRRRNDVYTVLRKVRGDMDELAQELERLTLRPVQKKTAALEIRGNYRRLIILWLTRLGF